DDPCHRVVAHARAEHLPHELLAPAPAKLAEADLLEASSGPELREEVVDVGAAEREDEERAIRQAAQGRVDELHRGDVAPVQILEEQDQGAVAALGDEKVLPGPEHLVAHQHRVVAGGPEFDALPILEAYARELAQELGDAGDILGREMPGHA